MKRTLSLELVPDSFKVKDRVQIRGTDRLGVIVYINPDHKLYEVKTAKSFQWPEYYPADMLVKIYADSLDRKSQVNEHDDVMPNEMAIGKRRRYKGKEYICMKVLERALDTCEGCSFNVTEDGEHWRCTLHEGSELGPCIGDERRDGNDVYFAECEES